MHGFATLRALTAHKYKWPDLKLVSSKVYSFVGPSFDTSFALGAYERLHCLPNGQAMCSNGEDKIHAALQK